MEIESILIRYYRILLALPLALATVGISANANASPSSGGVGPGGFAPTESVQCVVDTKEKQVELMADGDVEVETISTKSLLRMKVYWRGDLVLNVLDKRSENAPIATPTAAARRLTADEIDEIVQKAAALIPAGIGDGGRCSNTLGSKADENAKCGMLGVGAGILVGMVTSPAGGATAGTLVALACNWIVDKACEKDPGSCSGKNPP